MGAFMRTENRPDHCLRRAARRLRAPALGALCLAAAAGAAWAGVYGVERAPTSETLVLEDGRTVRLLGVWVPHADEHRKNRQIRHRYGISLRQALRFDAPARKFLARWTRGAKAEFLTDETTSDIKHQNWKGEWLGYVFVEVPEAKLEDFRKLAAQPGAAAFCDLEKNRLFLNAALLWKGFAVVSKDHPFSKEKEFRAVLKEARHAGRGMWKGARTPERVGFLPQSGDFQDRWAEENLPGGAEPHK
jgi:hypothetical protein